MIFYLIIYNQAMGNKSLKSKGDSFMITKEMLMEKAIEKGYGIMGENTIEYALNSLCAYSREFGEKDLTDTIILVATGKKEIDNIYSSAVDAIEYFERYRFEINNDLYSYGCTPDNIDGLDGRDVLCLGAYNKMKLAIWEFECAVGKITEWFDLEY